MSVGCPVVGCPTRLQASDGSRDGDPGTLKFGVSAHLRVVHGLTEIKADRVAAEVEAAGWDWSS
jgi:hypothetical protein